MSITRSRLVAGAAICVAALAAIPAVTGGGTPEAGPVPSTPPTQAQAQAQAQFQSPTQARRQAPTPASEEARAPVARPPRAAADQTRVLPRPQHGTAAIKALGKHLPAVAARARWSPSKLRSVLREDDTAYVSTQGRVYYRESDTAPTAGVPTSSGTYTPLYPTSQTFALHSRAGATRKIFLDFDGATVSGTSWNGTSAGQVPDGTHIGFDLDGNPSTFTSAEHGFIQEVWREVSETYAPFDVDVTTQDPGVAGIARASSTDTSFGTHVVITSSNTPRTALCGSCLGLAYVGTFAQVDPTAYNQPAWVFAYSKSFSPMVIAQAASHENGHTVGLSHDGTLANGVVAAAPYYPGTPAWGPIMGSSMNRAVSQFSKGEYALANNTEDDFAVMKAHGLPLRADDHVATESLGAQSSYAASGVIGTRTDTDSFAITLPCTTTLKIDAKGIGAQSALDLSLTVLDGNGATVASSSPASLFTGNPPTSTGMDASVSITGATGDYVLRVDGVGNGLAAAGGWSDYGSLGQYTLSATGCTTPPSTATPTPTPTPSLAPVGTSLPLPANNGQTASPPPPPTAAPRRAPRAPQIGRASPGAKGGAKTATARWAAPATTSQTPVASYVVQTLRIGKHGHVLRSYTSKALSRNTRALSMRLPKGKYRFRVLARNSAGSSPWSALSRTVRSR